MLLQLINQRLPRGSRPLNEHEAERLKKRYNRAKKRGDLDSDSDMESSDMEDTSEGDQNHSDLNRLNEQGESQEDEIQDGDSQQGRSGSGTGSNLSEDGSCTTGTARQGQREEQAGASGDSHGQHGENSTCREPKLLGKRAREMFEFLHNYAFGYSTFEDVDELSEDDFQKMLTHSRDKEAKSQKTMTVFHKLLDGVERSLRCKNVTRIEDDIKWARDQIKDCESE